MRAEDAADMLPATADEITRAVAAVCGGMGIGPAPGRTDAETEANERAFVQRLRETGQVLAIEDGDAWTVRQIRTAARRLVRSPDLDDKIRYGRPVTAADFERVRRDGLSERRVTETDDDGTQVERVIVTRSGYAMRVASAKLYTAGEAKALWDAAGSPGTFADGLPPHPGVAHLTGLSSHPDAMFSAVEVEDVGRRFRFKS